MRLMMNFKLVLMFIIISKISGNSIFDNKRKTNHTDIIMFVNGNKIVNVSLMSDFNFENNKNNKYIVTVNQIIDQNYKSLNEDEIIQNSAKLAAKGCALIINTSNKEDLGNIIATVVNLSVESNETQDLYKSFLFLITFDQPLNVNIKKTIKSEKFTQNSTSTQYDFHGASMYIWVIISIYSTFVLLLLILRVKPKGGTEATDRVKGEKFLRNMHENTHTRHILEQLRNENYRKKAWEIYNSDSNKKNETIVSEREEKTLRNLHKKIHELKSRKHSIFYSASIHSPTEQTSDASALSVPLIVKNTNKKTSVSTSKLMDEMKNTESLQISNLRDWAKNFETKFRAKFSNENEILNKSKNETCGKNVLRVNRLNYEKSLKNTSSASDFKTDLSRENSTVAFNFDTLNSNISLNKTPIPFKKIGDNTSYLLTPASNIRNLSISSSNKSSTLSSKEILPASQQNLNLTNKNNNYNNRGLPFLSSKDISPRSQKKKEIQLFEMNNEKNASYDKGIRFLLTPSDSPIFQSKVKPNVFNNQY